MRYLVLLFDGLEENAIFGSDNKTPLEAADKPCIDKLARYSLVGKVHAANKDRYSAFASCFGASLKTVASSDTGKESTELIGNSDLKKLSPVLISDDADARAAANDAGIPICEGDDGAAELAVSAFKKGKKCVFLHVEGKTKEDFEKLDAEVITPVYDYLKSVRGGYSIMLVPAACGGDQTPPLPFFLYSPDRIFAGTPVFGEHVNVETSAVNDRSELIKLMIYGALPEYGLAPSKTRSVSEFFELLVIALVTVMMLMTFVARHSPVIGSSMEQTLYENDVLIISDNYLSVDTGDIVIIQHQSQPEEPLVKRVIATGGQTIRIDYNTWQITVDGSVIDSSYAYKEAGEGAMRSFYFAVPDENGIWEDTVPEGMLFVMGDHRLVSKDSRSLGYIDERYVLGKVRYRILPLSRFTKF